MQGASQRRQQNITLEMGHRTGWRISRLTHRFVVDPEGHPGDDDDDEAREVDGLQEEGHLPPELELHAQAAVRS